MNELPDLVDVYWTQGSNGHRGESEISPDMMQHNRLFETGRDQVNFGTTEYVKTLDEAITRKQEPTVHLRYARKF